MLYCIVECASETTPTSYGPKERSWQPFCDKKRTFAWQWNRGPGDVCRLRRASWATQHHGARKEWQPAHHIPLLVRLCPAAAIPGTILGNLAPSSLRPLGRCSSSPCTLKGFHAKWTTLTTRLSTSDSFREIQLRKRARDTSRLCLTCWHVLTMTIILPILTHSLREHRFQIWRG